MKYRQWNLRPQNETGRAALEAAGIPVLAARALCARGVDTPEAAWAFLSADLSLLHDPFLLLDMDKAAARITAALAAGEPMAVYGDYDVDGISATCLLTDYLRSRGGDVTMYIPDRMEEGYGVSRGALDALRTQGVRLVMTVDCGITAVDEARYARETGMELIITDHHECKAELPDAVAVVDPHRPGCPYPFKNLAGVGVALKLVLALGGYETPKGAERDMEEIRLALLARYADLAAIGTVADVMLLAGENRAIVRLGLDVLGETRRPGLKALLEEAGLGGKPLVSSAIGYTLAPRINASGRMGCAALAAELLLTPDAVRGEELARELCALNRERQNIELGIFETCLLMAAGAPGEERFALVLASSGWHQGVTGIVASRLSEKFSCPAFMICLQDGRGKGSCRSYGGFNLFAALEACEDLLEGFGGHELAAGFTILEENISAFRTRMNDIVAAATGGAEMIPTLEVDAALDDPTLLSLEEISALDVLEPYGSGNQRPVFSLAGCTIIALSEVGGGRHLKLRVTFRGRPLDAIFFSSTAADCGLAVGDRVDLAFHPQINEYRGRRSVQLQLADLRPAQTRAQAERALWEKYRRGEYLTAAEAASLTPSRDEFAGLWRYLKSRSTGRRVEETTLRLAKNVAHATGLRETFPRTMICLEVFHERGLVQVERTTDRLRIEMNTVEGKVDLEESYILRNLRKIVGD
ncbi:Single-stranded-DNA-specific exonuclease RecJ [uncultured Eubacteriales bacterium]|uniref:Single-stranded-DNA-specific exonuclease RecJ n=1 Tax=uncultured Eubacteriales bacterium TaxID=172733 RepID=A0A212KHR0_9FIRM|nr:Single-stranded-DNA-specific exonuclease RecJ [uncultured Eubacteriales bacterium]